VAIEFWMRVGGTWRKAKEVHMKVGGTWRKAKDIWYRTGGTWRKVFNVEHSVSITPSPAEAITYCNPDPPFVLCSDQSFLQVGVTAVVTNGVGPFTYAWTFISNPAGCTFTAASAATTNIRLTPGNYGTGATGTARCTVTDTGNGNLQKTADVNFELYYGPF
jgi:hypothetical protein